MTTTREEYLTAAAAFIQEEVIQPVTKANSPAVKISIGWPYGSRGGKKTLAQCFSKACSDGQHNEIFITPAVADTMQALSSLAHELVHAEDDCASGHTGAFKRVARAIDLQGKLTETHAGPKLTEWLEMFVEENGQLPHITMVEPTGKKKPGSRSKKVECLSCGFTMRTTQKWLALLDAESPCPVCKVPGALKVEDK